MGEEKAGKPPPIFLPPELVEEILLRNRRILAAVVVDHRPESRRFEGDEEEEIEVFYTHCDYDDDLATRPSLTCDGLVCIPVPGWVNVLNLSTGESVGFPSGPDPVTNYYDYQLSSGYWWNMFPAFWAMGFGRDIVDRSYKVVRMFFDPNHFAEVLDVSIGEWRRLLNPPPYKVDARRKSACVNGSIYWLELHDKFCVLALDLHTEEFRVFPPPPFCSESDQVVNLENRLAIARANPWSGCTLEIRCLDAQEETWSLVYSIDLMGISTPRPPRVWFRPVAISKQGNVFFYDSKKRLFKYHPRTSLLLCLSPDIQVVSPSVENLVSLRPSSSHPTTFRYQSGFHNLELLPPRYLISRIFRKIESRIPPCILLTTALASLVVFRYFAVLSRS
ncbi:PREDICTED: F-box/LRR-repeat protein At2g43260-like isoform X2 [Camelina sativa]|uniref:F-box/LRR-repeat protein At2g43260-like isoform X2 n=1 Tax=Camelina sativa TaxID=90675 RepID=A0ABM0ZLF3_CAMSA|nr:PREDICTED: F-box/LRR-repeat protein At2g43260-like isoform X2 [Camelina sativa]